MAKSPDSGGEYQVVARRYRPQQFADLVGQEPVAQALANAITGDRVAHAYLFTGARGVGKTSTARILAKALNCVAGPTPTPCDRCDNCVRIAAGDDIDVQEIDGATNRNLDDIRSLRQNVNTRPTRSRYKIYIIDEVHMLTRESFNALLKTLEEPPPHVKFIFATTEVTKIPVTILSRCQRFDFGGITPAKIAGQLKRVVVGEGMSADDEALAVVARRAGGSMRDAESLLEQLLAAAPQGRLTADQVHAQLGTAADDRVRALADVILAKDAKGALELVGRCAEEGLQLGEVLDQLIDYWRGLMLVSCGGSDVAGLDAPEAHRAALVRHAGGLTLDTVLAGLDVLTTARGRLRTTGHALVVAEMAVVRLARLDDLIPLTQLARALTDPNARPVVAAVAPAGDAKKNVPLTDNVRPVLGLAPVAASAPPPAGAESPRDFAGIWGQVREKVGVMLAAQLDKANSPANSGPSTLVIRFPNRYSREYEFCREPAQANRVEAALKQITGRAWGVRFDLDSAVPAAPGVVPLAPPPTARERTGEALKHPLLAKAVEVLEARPLKIDDGFGAPAAPADERVA